ncbi:MAG: hypothetical protein QNL97_05470 [Pseudomonadales bacterium]|jgi:hypothetical protein
MPKPDLLQSYYGDKHRGRTARSEECSPGYYNMEGDSQRRQDGNYYGGFRQYFQHQGEVREKMEKTLT